MSRDFIWNTSQAEQIRATNERVMNQQIRNMEATVDIYRSWIPRMRMDANAQDSIARDPSRSNTARERARRRARSLREQIELTQNAIIELNRAIDDLRDAITATNLHFGRMHVDARATDAVFSRHIQSIDGDISAYIEKMEGIKNSFSEYGFEENWRLHLLNSVETMGVAFKESVTYATAVLSLQEGGLPIGHVLAANWRPQDIRNMLKGIQPNFIREGARLPGAYTSHTLGQGRLRFIGPAAGTVGFGLNAAGHFREHRNPGRAFSYSTYMLVGSGATGLTAKALVGTTGTAVGTTVGGTTIAKAIGIKVWPIGVAIVTGYVMRALYHNVPVVRDAVHLVGDLINDFIASPPPITSGRAGPGAIGRAYFHRGRGGLR